LPLCVIDDLYFFPFCMATPIKPVFRLGLPRFLFFEIGASAIVKD